jgi:hypothetical protein
MRGLTPLPIFAIADLKDQWALDIDRGSDLCLPERNPRGGGLLRFTFVRGAPVWFPKSSADDLHHFNVVGLKSFIDRTNACHLYGIERHNLPD